MMIREWCAGACAVYAPLLKPLCLVLWLYSGLIAVDHVILLWVRAQ